MPTFIAHNPNTGLTLTSPKASHSQSLPLRLLSMKSINSATSDIATSTTSSDSLQLPYQWGVTKGNTLYPLVRLVLVFDKHCQNAINSYFNLEIDLFSLYTSLSDNYKYALIPKIQLFERLGLMDDENILVDLPTASLHAFINHCSQNKKPLAIQDNC